MILARLGSTVQVIISLISNTRIYYLTFTAQVTISLMSLVKHKDILSYFARLYQILLLQHKETSLKCLSPGGETKESGNCRDGYYCPAGSSSNTQNSCPAGSYCPGASPNHVPCPVSADFLCYFCNP